MRKSIVYYAATAALLLVGAGCAGSVTQETSVGAPSAAPSGSEAMMRADDDAEAKVEGSVDASVDELLMEADADMKAQADLEKNADEVGADGASIKAYSDSSYEIQ
jgi:hypothetical protein